MCVACCGLFVVVCLGLFIVCLLVGVCCFLFVVCRLLLLTDVVSSLFVVRCWLLVVVFVGRVFMLMVAGSWLFGVWCSLCGVCGSLFVLCCLLLLVLGCS